MPDSRSRTAICAFESLPRGDDGEEDRSPAGQHLREKMVARPGFGFVRTLTSPPPAGTRSSPVASVVAKMIESSAPQLAPRPVPFTGVTLTGGPPLAATFLRASPSKNPIDCPSGEKKERARALTPVIRMASNWSRERT